MTNNRLIGAVTGAFVTAVLNSSSVTTVLVVSFITAGVMTLTQSVGVIMGANIGSTMTAQLLAFNISSYALLPIAVGFFMTFTAKTEGIKYVGMMVMGLGMVFFGMGIMSSAMTPLRSYEPFMVFLKNMEQPLLGDFGRCRVHRPGPIVRCHRRHRHCYGHRGAAHPTGRHCPRSGCQYRYLRHGIACGPRQTCRGSAGRNCSCYVQCHWRADMAAFIGSLADLAIAVSPTGTGAEIPRQIANANTLFNVINTLLFIGFTPWFARLAVKLYPERPEKAGIIIEPKYIDVSALSVPAVALEQVRKEFGRMGQIALTMLSELPHAVLEKDKQHVDTIVMLDDKVDILEAAIFGFLGKIRQQSLTAEESKVHQDLMTATVNLETLSDVIETDLSNMAKIIIDKEQRISRTTWQTFEELYKEVYRSVELAVKSIRDEDQQAASQVINKKATIRELSESLLARESASIGMRPGGGA